MDPFEMMFVPMVLFMVIVAPIWIVMHYRSLNRSSRSLSEDGDPLSLGHFSIQHIQVRAAVEEGETI